MTIEAGQTLPDQKIKLVTADGVVDTTVADVFGQGRSVLIGLPGAFTPGCSMKHVPSYLNNYDKVMEKADRIVCLSVNDAFVMGAWADNLGARGKIDFLADGAAVLTKALGLDIDLSGGAMGIRAKRFAAYIVDGVVQKLNVEDSPGIVECSTADGLMSVI